MKIEKEVLKVCKRTAVRLQSTIYKFLLPEDSVEEIAPPKPGCFGPRDLPSQLPDHLITQSPNPHSS